MKDEVQKANSVANVELTHNKINLNRMQRYFGPSEEHFSNKSSQCRLSLRGGVRPLVHRWQDCEVANLFWKAIYSRCVKNLQKIHTAGLSNSIYRELIPRKCSKAGPTDVSRKMCAAALVTGDRKKTRRNHPNLQLRGNDPPNYAPFFKWILK